MLKCITKKTKQNKREDTHWEQGEAKQLSQNSHSSAWKLETAWAQERRKKAGYQTWDSISYTQGLGTSQMAPVEIPLTDH